MSRWIRPEDLEAYRLEKRRVGGESWLNLATTRETRYHDAGGKSTDRYRLYAINGLGDEFYLGETGGERAPSADGKVVAYPVPYCGGEMTILFRSDRVNGSVLETTVTIYDVGGRRIRTVTAGRFTGETGLPV